LTSLVTLIDGRQVPNDSEDYRAECEARAVCKMGGHWRTDSETGRRHFIRPRIARKLYVEAVEKKRGQASAEQLRAMVMVVWDAEFANLNGN
jgi:hypothetical protein